ncbi:MAG: hypothetical protein ACJAWD_000565, partial [Methylophilaceae bacterium]
MRLLTAFLVLTFMHSNLLAETRNELS